MNHVSKNDVVVTQDIGLASILVKKGIFVLSPRGKRFAETEMEVALFSRYISAKQRREGKYGKGPKPFTDKERMQFKQALETFLSNNEGICY